MPPRLYGTPRPYIPPRLYCARGVALLGGAAVPRDCFGGILRHTEALGVHPPEVVLRAGVALLGGAAVPRDRFGVILRHADAGDIHAAEDALRRGVARLGGGAEVCEGLCGWPVFILCLNTGRTAHREGEGGDHEGAAHKVATARMAVRRPRTDDRSHRPRRPLGTPARTVHEALHWCVKHKLL